MKERNAAIDLFKYIAAILVIGIHTGLFSDLSQPLYVFTVQIVCRMAVPFFAVCSGYLLARKLAGGALLGMTVKQQWRRILLLYAVWSVLYLKFSIPSWIRSGWFSAWAFVDFGIATIRSNSHYHLWYLNSMIYALPFLYLCLRWVKDRYLLVLAVPLYAVKVLMYGYRAWMPASVSNLFGLMENVSGLCDGVFCLLPLMLLGVCIARRQRIERKTSLIGAAASFLFLTVEVILLYRAGQENVSYVLFTFPLSYFFFCVVLSLRNIPDRQASRTLGASSLFIYCSHPMLVETVGKCLKSETCRFFVVACLSTLAGVAYVRIKAGRKDGMNHV